MSGARGAVFDAAGRGVDGSRRFFGSAETVGGSEDGLSGVGESGSGADERLFEVLECGWGLADCFLGAGRVVGVRRSVFSSWEMLLLLWRTTVSRMEGVPGGLKMLFWSQLRGAHAYAELG